MQIAPYQDSNTPQVQAVVVCCEVTSHCPRLTVGMQNSSIDHPLPCYSYLERERDWVILNSLACIKGSCNAQTKCRPPQTQEEESLQTRQIQNPCAHEYIWCIIEHAHIKWATSVRTANYTGWRSPPTVCSLESIESTKQWPPWTLSYTR